MQLKRMFDNLFDSPAISQQGMRLFAEDHLRRLSVQNTQNVYDQILTDTQAAYGNYFGKLTDTDTASSIRQSRTVSMNNVMKRFKAEVVDRRKLILFIFKEDSPEFQEFFPIDAKEYSNANLENVETLMQRLKAASSKHQARLGAETATVFTNLLEQFRTARGAQLDQKAEVSDHIDKKASTAVALQLQLTKNVLVIALNNIGKPEAAKLFFNESLLGLPKSKTDDGGDQPPPAPAS